MRQDNRSYIVCMICLAVIVLLCGQEGIPEVIMSTSTILLTLVVMMFFGILIKSNESVCSFIEDITGKEY